MSNNLQDEDDSMPALVSAGEDVPAEEDSRGEEPQGAANGDKVQTTFMWYQFNQDIVNPATILTSEKVHKSILDLKSAPLCVNAGVCLCVCICVQPLFPFEWLQVNNGSVELYQDASGEFFSSTSVPVEKGRHEAQLCYKYSDGYEEIYPLKPFEVERDNDIIIVSLDIQQRRGGFNCVCVSLIMTELH